MYVSSWGVVAKVHMEMERLVQGDLVVPEPQAAMWAVSHFPLPCP